MANKLQPHHGPEKKDSKNHTFTLRRNNSPTNGWVLGHNHFKPQEIEERVLITAEIV